MDFAVPTAHKVKIKENEKIDQFLDFAGEQKKKQKKKLPETWGWQRYQL